MRKLTLLYLLLFGLSSNVLASEIMQENLFKQVASGTECNQVPNNGLYCKYEIGNKLSFSIKDVGGKDTVVGFHYSNINEKLYAVYYFNCIVIVPGHAHPKNYDKNYGIYISPRNGKAYKTKQECQSH